MSDSVRPHRWKPTRLPRPRDSPGKNTGVGCHFLLQCMKVKSEREVAQSCPTLSDPNGLQPTRFLHPWDFPGKSTGVGCHCLLQLPSRDSKFWNCISTAFKQHWGGYVSWRFQLAVKVYQKGIQGKTKIGQTKLRISKDKNV